jgi:hypothetical protein
MNERKAALELLGMAREVLSLEFPTQKALENYRKTHKVRPGTKLTVKPSGGGSKPSGAKPSGSKKQTPGGGEARHRKKMPTVKSLSRVKNIIKSHGMDEEADELQEMAGFKSTLGQRVPAGEEGDYYVRNKAKLKKDFLAKMSAANYDSPEAFAAAKKRIQAMPVSDFGKVLAAISDEDEG